ncbi:MAG TPA: bifunctional 2-C-methyl-D-erythritol 4-phosphate cytidylyltransferase/2-C-methyl-D-erythritol 2,4-cyclodiphosphate synthase [Stellaceae bacterium]|jgi:2-C-methyl-D-erythritol 4-phosphate cytidylyltransferase/2-C-methyl-D-erythritol 2,4-cyclodiphosphate synthase|nr:bifunctional 2-C-methyl-D-erythritol 4-phosphate cytidylyltransferase/2-C-methyl-D-erythritol 2,4-cyclodiphosphate synthase [Stellaceae bacterium]
MTNSIALVVAAGRGTRFGGTLPKQYRTLAGTPVLRHSLETLRRHPAIGAVRVVFNPDDRSLYERATAGIDLLPPVAGGNARQESVRLGLESLTTLEPDAVLIHDAARPFLDHPTIDRVMSALDEAPGAIPALPVRDTMKRGQNGRIAETLDRTHLWRAQTPQGFRYAAILAAHRQAIGLDLPDDAAVAERAGLAVKLVAGSEANFKVTTEDDLREAERRVASGLGDVRIGQGFDVHAFGPGDHLWLCGVKILHDHGLIGHSDADAGLHALTDAILGTIGAGDIGLHFPPGDPQWRGAPSDQFLRHACALVRAQGGTLAHVDVTIICERPKIGPHRAAMVARVAEILGLDPSRVSVKATTTETLGFTGRGEGLAAQAVATVRLPL